MSAGGPPSAMPSPAHRADVGDDPRATSSGLAIAGGQVPTLLNRLHLLGVGDHVGGLHVFAWSAGAMVVTERIVVFHDDPPHGRPYARVFERRARLVPGVVALPHARRRLHLDDARARWPPRPPLRPGGVPRPRRRRPPRLARSAADGDAREHGAPRFVVAAAPSRADGSVDELARRPNERPMRSIADPAHIDGPSWRRSDATPSPIPSAVDRFVDGRAFPLVEDRHVAHSSTAARPTRCSLRHWVYGLAATPTFTRLDGTDLWYLVLDAPARLAHRVQVRGDPRRPRRVDRGPAQPAAAPAIPSAPTRSCRATGYERPDWTFAGPRGAHRHDRRAHRCHERRRSGATSTSTSTSRRASVATGRYPLLVVHDGSDYLDYSAMQAVLDNLIHRLEMADDRRRASPTRRIGSSSTPTTSRTPASSPRSSCRGSETEFPLRRPRPAGAA